MSSHWPGDELRVKLRRSGRQTEPAEQGAISLVGEDGSRLIDRDPRELVDLLGRAEAPAAGSHRPVRDHLVPASPVPISRTAYEPLQPAAQPGLLLHFTECAYVLFLSGHQFALGEGPVVVRRPVNEGDLDAAVTTAPHDPPCGPDQLARERDSDGLCLHARIRYPASVPIPGSEGERKVNNSYRYRWVDILAARANSFPGHSRRDRDDTGGCTGHRGGPIRSSRGRV